LAQQEYRNNEAVEFGEFDVDDTFHNGTGQEQQVQAFAPVVAPDYARTLVSNAYTAQVEALLNEGLDPSLTDDYANTLLHVAASAECGGRAKREMCELLIRFGADVNARNSQGKTVLRMCDPETDRKLIKLLSAHGAEA